MLIVAFDTATDTATSALVDDGEVVGERFSRPVSVLEDVDALLRQAGARTSQLDAVAVGTGPGSFTGLRMGIAAARGIAAALDIPVAGVSTLDALAAGAPGAVPVIDARRREVFTLLEGAPHVTRPDELVLEARSVCVGDGAIRYRDVLVVAGAEVPPDDDERHRPRARFHALLARDFGAPDRVEPVYLRVPDAERAAR